ncbi:hypothetical protein SAMN05421730_100641 [Anaerobium acetethylicum]|uniref:Uncharacterized protein n=2 Tax=Anaerobium acetethylicum TaxID=1619234 RepID=A0A1D3TSA7_9FIRM|nr:hypothetical protein SAMN05421730_100641 [Anaerobium acetethylicum]
MKSRMKHKSDKTHAHREQNPYLVKGLLFNKDRRALIRMAMDVFDLILGSIIIIMTVAAFLKPGVYGGLFPVIFILGAFLNLMTGAKHFYMKNRFFGVFFMVIGFLLFAAAAVSFFMA